MTVSDKDILAKVESELKFHMDEARVPQDVQLLVYKCGYDSMRIFAGLDDTKEAVRSALKEELPLDYTASPEKRRNMALLLSVWDTCRLQLSVQEKHKSEAKLGTHTRLIQTTEHASLRSAIEAVHGDLCDKAVPSKIPDCSKAGTGRRQLPGAGRSPGSHIGSRCRHRSLCCGD